MTMMLLLNRNFWVISLRLSRYAALTEPETVIHATTAQKLVYTLTFPLFMLTYLPISLAALFMKVEWKPIHHSVRLAAVPTPMLKN